MNSFKIRFSDILRYFILGGLEFLLYILIVDQSAFEKLFGDSTTSLSAMQIAVVCIGIYLIGFITQSVIQLFFGGDFLGTGIGEVAEYIRFYPTMSFNSRGYPDWVYWSDRPRRVLDIYKDILETDDNAEIKTEFLYSNQLFQGTAFAIFFASAYKYITTFDCISAVGRIGIMASLLVLIWIIHKFCGQSKRILIPVILGLLVSIAILFIGHTISDEDSWFYGILLACSYFIASGLAASLARKQIRRVDVLAKFNGDSVNAEIFKIVLARVGAPKFYILTRTNSPEFLSDELESICTQTYPNIKVIILLDRSLNSQKSMRKRLFKTIDAYRDRLNIQTYESSKTGPAALAYEIREIYLNYANADDIAMILDSDDKLYSPSVVSQIVTRMFRTLSNICLIRFEIFGNQNLNYARNHHNELVKAMCYEGEISPERMRPNVNGEQGVKVERVLSITPEKLRDCNELHRISTLGWTKCYRKAILSEYHEIIKTYLETTPETTLKNTLKKTPEELLNDRKYEDFTDIIALMHRGAKICAVAKNSVLFRKRENSVTTNVSTDNYSKHIPFFLKLAKELASANQAALIAESCDVIAKKLIPYKFIQYLKVVHIKTSSEKGEPGYDENLAGYNCTTFYKDFLKNVYGVKFETTGGVIPEYRTIVSDFQKNVESLLKGYDKDILGVFSSEEDGNISWNSIEGKFLKES